MSIKIHISYTENEESKVNTIKAFLKDLLPCYKVKNNTGTPPYNHLYFTPTKAEKTTKYGDNA